MSPLPELSALGSDVKVLLTPLEVLIVNSAIANNIREGKTHQIPSAMQTGGKYGMVTLDGFLLNKYRDGMIAREEVVTKAQDPTTILQKLQELDLELGAGLNEEESMEGESTETVEEEHKQ